jgi:hypothetical protein
MPLSSAEPAVQPHEIPRHFDSEGNDPAAIMGKTLPQKRKSLSVAENHPTLMGKTLYCDTQPRLNSVHLPEA